MEPADSFDVLYNALIIKDKDKRIQSLRHLIESGVNVNSCWNEKCKSKVEFEDEGLTVLMAAARYGDIDCVQVLLDAGANVNQSDVGGRTALIEAASAGHVECVASAGHVECMRLLLEAGADVDQSGSYGTALTHAASNGSDKCIKLLIEAGANVNLSDELGDTALMAAARCGSVKCMELLLEAGSDVNGVDSRGDTALICCLNYYNYSKVEACLKLLINTGADIDVKNNKSLQPIHFALRCWQRAIFPVEYLISENCNLNQASYNQVKACVNRNPRNYVKLDLIGRLDMLKLLFDCGLPRHLCQSFIVEQDTSVRNWVETVASQPNTLKSICVFKIRTNLGHGIKTKVTKLNLPTAIQNLILLQGILSSECFD